MARFLPPLWLLGAVLYTAGTLLFVHAIKAEPEPGALIIPINESIRAKQTPADDARAALPPLPRPPLHGPQPGEMAEVAGYMAVVRAHPSQSAHVLAGYPVGQPFRVIARDGAFARVQDLGSGQLGWIRVSALGPYMDGYRRRPVIAAPLVAAAPQTMVVAQAPAPQVEAVAPETPAAAASARKPFALGPAPAPAESPVDTKTSDRPVRVAQDDSLASIMQRAFSGAH
jgi:hypothetical protein